MKRTRIIVIGCALAASSSCCLASASPLSPAQERATFRLADSNLVVELVAAEPDVRAPVAIAWDADGRMFVAEMTDYPSGPVNGRIRLLEDRDGDGRYERATIFATNLAFPNGVMAWKNGVLVTAAPDIWYLADTNGDGVADVRGKILTGFTEGNQQLRVNGLYWGIDNWIYGCNGRSDGEVKWADGTPAGSIRRHDFRFRPDTKQFEVIAGNSQFGMGHDAWGNRFPVFNNTPIRHVVIEDRYLARQPLLAGTDNVPSISPTNDGNRVFALTPPMLLIPQPVGFFTSACGPSIFRGTALPESYRGNYFVCEPVQNLVQRRVLKPNGSTFIAEYADASGSPPASTGRGVRGEERERRDASDNANATAPNHPSPSIPLPVEGRGKPETKRESQDFHEFLASTDRWFHGVFTAPGPDGAFYIVDFYRDLVEHPHWVAPELRDKIDWRKGEEHGRIWRVRAKDAKFVKVEQLSRASNTELVRALESDNGWTQDTAQRLLIERLAKDQIAPLEAVARSATRETARVHALNTLDGLGLRNVNLLVATLADTSARVREQAVRLIGPTFTSAAWNGPAMLYDAMYRELFARCDDADSRVRLAAACAWSAKASDEKRFAALGHVVQHGDFDFWQSLPVLAGVAERPWLLLDEAKPLLENGTDEQLQFLTKLCAATVASKQTNHIATLSSRIVQSQSPNRFALAAAFVEASPIEDRAGVVMRLGGARLSIEAAALCTNAAVSLGTRIAAVRWLDNARSTSAVAALRLAMDRIQPEPLQAAATKALMEWGDIFARQTLELWSGSSKVSRRQMLASSLKSAYSSLALLDLVESGRIAKPEIDPPTRQALQKHRDSTVVARAKMIFEDAVSPDRQAIVEKYRAALKLDGDRKHGAEIYERACAVCHQMQGVGAKVGPDLSGIGQHARETLLVDILDPSRQVLPDFVAYNATTKSGGDTYTGFIASESTTTITLRRANEPDITLQRTELKEFNTSGKSLMPDGLEAGMSEQDMADLIEFLRRPDRTLFTQSNK